MKSDNNKLVMSYIALMIVMMNTADIQAKSGGYRKYHIWWMDQNGQEHSALIDGSKHLEIPILTFITDQGKTSWGLYQEPVFRSAQSCGCIRKEQTSPINQNYPLLNEGVLEDQFSSLMDHECHIRKVLHLKHALHKLQLKYFKSLIDQSCYTCRFRQDFINPPKENSSHILSTNYIELSYHKLPDTYVGSVQRDIFWVGQIAHLVLFNLCQRSFSCGAHGSVSCEPHIIDLKKHKLLSYQELAISDQVNLFDRSKMKDDHKALARQEQLITDAGVGDPQWIGFHIDANHQHYTLLNMWQVQTCFACSSSDWSSYTYRFMTPASSQTKSLLPEYTSKLPAVLQQFIRTKKAQAFGWSPIHEVYYSNLENWFTGFHL